MSHGIRRAAAVPPVRFGEAEIHRQLQRAVQLYQSGEVRECARVLRRLEKRAPDNPDVFGLYGTLKVQAGRHAEAVSLLLRALRLAPDNASFHGNLAVAYEGLKRLDKAVEHYRRALALDPTIAQSHANLGAVLWSQGEADEAIAHYREAIALKPEFAQAHLYLAQALHQRGDVDGALTSAQRAAELDPVMAKAHLSIGRALQAKGDVEAALPFYRRAIEIDPTLAEAYKSYVYAAKVVEDDPVVESLRRQVARDDLDPIDEACFYYALGKVHDASHEYDTAFEAWARGARLRRKALDFSMESLRARFSGTKRTFTKDMFDAHHVEPIDGPAPIFVVGLPRSGTTLVEQILASHPEVHGGGELTFVGDLVRNFAEWSETDAPFPQGMAETSDAALRNAAKWYLECVSPPPSVSHFTDKLPGNFQLLGLIALLLPHARVIHCLRNSLDNAVSCFTTDFVERQEWSYDLAEIGEYYGLHLDLMAHWHTCLPLPIYEVHYESVVADLEGQARALLAFCDLLWDDRVLSFHETDRPVLTASSSQVRQSLYGSSVERWRRYEKHLRPLREHLPATIAK